MVVVVVVVVVIRLDHRMKKKREQRSSHQKLQVFPRRGLRPRVEGGRSVAMA